MAALSALASSSVISSETLIPELIVPGTGFFTGPRPVFDIPEVPRMVGVLTIPDPVDVTVEEARYEGEREELAIVGGLDTIFSGLEVSRTPEDMVSR